MKNTRLKWLPALAFLFALLILVSVLTFTDLRYRRYDHIENSRLVFEQGTERTDQQYGVMNSGPALSVSGGQMKLNWDIESDGVNAIRIQSTNKSVIDPSEIRIDPGRSTGSVLLYALDDIYDLQVLVDYRDGSYIRVNRIDLSVKKYMDGFFTTGFLLLSGALICALWALGILPRRRCAELVIVLTAVLIASIPDLRGHLHAGHDDHFHWGRLMNLAHELRNGQFPVRLGGYLQNGYGAVMSVYYPELFLYIPALMIVAGASLTYSYHVLFIMMHLSAALSMWYAVRKIFKSDVAGVTAAVAYTLSLYRLIDIYTRFAVGESLAMSILPLFALGLYEVLLGDKRRWKLLAVSAAMICQSHLISTVLCGVVAASLAIVCSVKIIRERRMAPLVKAAALALLLNMFFFLPLYTYSQQGVEASKMKRDLNHEALTPAQMFLDPMYVENVEDDGLKEHPLGLGLPLIIMAAASVYTVLMQEKREREDHIALFLCAAGVGFAIMSTNVFPWGIVVSMTHGMAEYIQFPWRLLMLTTLCFAMAGGCAVSKMAKGENGLIQFAVLSLCAVCALPLVSQETRKENYLPERELPYWDQRFGDYVLPGTKLYILDKVDPIVSEGIEMSDYIKKGTNIDAHIACDQSGNVVFPLYAFDGYSVKLDGQEMEISANENSYMLIEFEEGMDGDLQIRFEGKRYWRFGDGISLASLLILCLSGMKKRPCAKHNK